MYWFLGLVKSNKSRRFSINKYFLLALILGLPFFSGTNLELLKFSSLNSLPSGFARLLLDILGEDVDEDEDEDDEVSFANEDGGVDLDGPAEGPGAEYEEEDENSFVNEDGGVGLDGGSGVGRGDGVGGTDVDGIEDEVEEAVEAVGPVRFEAEIEMSRISLLYCTMVKSSLAAVLSVLEGGGDGVGLPAVDGLALGTALDLVADDVPPDGGVGVVAPVGL